MAGRINPEFKAILLEKLGVSSQRLSQLTKWIEELQGVSDKLP